MFVLQVDYGLEVATLMLRYPQEYLIQVVSRTHGSPLDASKIHDVVENGFSGGVEGANGLVEGCNNGMEALLAEIMSVDRRTHERRLACQVPAMYISAISNEVIDGALSSHACGEVQGRVAFVVKNGIYMDGH